MNRQLTSVFKTKRLSHLRALVALIMAAGLLSACHSDIDLANVDGTAEVNVGVSLPIGSISATVKDFMATSADIYFDSVGVLTLKKGTRMVRNYHAVDLSQYIHAGKFGLKVHDKLEEKGLLITNPLDGKDYIYGMGIPVDIPFPMELKLEGINHNTSAERLDSALIEMAKFVSRIGQEHMDGLLWDYVDTVELKLGKNFSRNGGNTIVVYDKAHPVTNDYDQDIPMDIDHFTLCLMKDKNLNPKTDWYRYPSNTDTVCTFEVRIRLTVPNGIMIEVPKDAAFVYNLGVSFITYTAIWGYFDPSNLMRDRDSKDLTGLFESASFLKDANLPFADPSIDINVITTIAGAPILHAEHLYTTDKEGQRHYAHFSGDTIFDQELKGYLDPATSQIGDSTKNIHLRFDKDPERGQIDQLFLKMPQSISYDWTMSFSQRLTPQIRITPNTDIILDATAVLPMKFQKGVKISTSDTLRNIDLSQIKLDSLINTVDYIDTLKTANLTLYLTITNTIPLAIKLHLIPFDENNQIVTYKDEQGNDVQLFNDTILLEAPTFENINGKYVPTTSNPQVLTELITKPVIDKLPTVKTIKYELWVDDDSLKSEYYPIQITKDGKLKVQIGITADVDAILNLAAGENKNNK